jgi:ribosome maturation factor RimP
MSPPTAVQRLWEIAEPFATHEGFEVVDIECRSEGRRFVFRLFVDRPGGVTVGDLSRLSRQLGDLLDVRGQLDGPYTLEISSPGINRRLARPAHYARFVGQRVRVRTATPVAGRRNFLGTLVESTAEDFALRLPDGGEVRIPYGLVLRANYEHDFGADARRESSAGSAAGSARKGRRA